MIQRKSFMQKKITYNPFFWVILTITSLCCIFFAYHFFGKAFPIVNLDITMDRQQALAHAQQLADTYQWGPQQYRQAASFTVDSDAQNYIELEHGGPQAFAAVLKEGYFSPYTWQVRLFKEFDPMETWVYFTPQGTPYGFNQQIPENYAAPSLSIDDASKLAVDHATSNWRINFQDYTLVEKSQDIKPNGRIDYTFVYEHAHKKIGAAPYRLTLEVSGNLFSKLMLSLQVPEAFQRKYQEMRSANNTIALIANALMILLYILGGCLIGLYLLAGAEWIIWKKATLAAFILALLITAHTINTLPLAWLNYDTALSLQSFLGSFGLRIFIQFILTLLGYSVIIAAAETLTRKAFPDHLQFWKLWTTDVAASWQMLGRAIGSYLILGFDFAFAIGLYSIASTYWGWWSPSESLYSPNTLATYIPWLSPIAQSVNAGFIEECLFRAIPLASAILLGNRFGKKRLWFIMAFIIQAIIFGAAHANYPAQPSYARLIELIIPSFVFGTFYIMFGLMTSIISHIIYDIVWFSLPIFVSHATDIWQDKLLIIFFTLFPLLLILKARLTKGYWANVSLDTYNNAWHPVERTVPFETSQQYPEETINRRTVYTIVALGIIGFISWSLFTRYDDYSLHLKLSRKEAMSQACNIVHTSYSSTQCWDLLSNPEAYPSEQHIFVWRTSGKELFQKMVGTYLTPPVWKIRFAQFNGDIAQRAEEYQINIAGSGILWRSTHILPEGNPGAQLSKEQARTIAYQGLNDRFGMTQDHVEEISAQSSKRPARIDWLFIFKMKENVIKNGEQRVQITISGDTVTDANRYIFIPEDWLRAFKQEQMIKAILMMVCSLIIMAIGAIMCLVFIKRRHQMIYSYPIFFIISIILFLKSCIQFINLWPTFQSSFQTNQPYANQLISLVCEMAAQVIFKALIWGAFSGLIYAWRFKIKPTTSISLSMRLITGIGVGLIGSGFIAFITSITPFLKPEWVDYISAGAFIPFMSIGLISFTRFIEATAQTVLVFLVFDLLSSGWHRKKLETALFSLVGSVAVIGWQMADALSVPFWFIIGSVTGLLTLVLYIWLIRKDRSLIPIIVGTVMILNTIRFAIVNGFPGAFAGSLFAILLIGLGAWWLMRVIREQDLK